jgi:PKD repeat protein
VVNFVLNVGAGSATVDPFQSITVNFGDGSVQELGAASGTVNLVHVYDSSDTYTVTATGTTANRDSQSATTVIFVARRPPIDVSVSPTAATVNVSQLYTAKVTVPAGSSVRSVTWDFGDTAPFTTSGTATSHVYKETGTKTLRVTVRSTDGNTGTGIFQISVSPPGP